MKYIVLLVSLINGNYEQFEVDFNVSREDCAAIIAEGITSVEWDGVIIPLDEAETTYVCEILPEGGL